MKTKFINIVKHFLLFFLVSLPLNLLAIDSSSRSTQESEYLNLKNLINNGSFNFAIFKRLAEIAPTPEAKLAYLRQADILSPRESTISSQIESTKEILNKNSPAKSFTSNKKILDIVSPKSYIPFYIQDFIIVGFSLTLVVLGFRQKRDIKTYLTLILLVFFLADKLFVSYTRSGDLKIIDSMSDITKSEGIVLNSIKTYASQDTTSQVTFVLKAGNEVDINSINPKKEDWIKVRFNNGRSGWIQYLPESLYIIRR